MRGILYCNQQYKIPTDDSVSTGPLRFASLRNDKVL
jgi:hypothetical protein